MAALRLPLIQGRPRLNEWSTEAHVHVGNNLCDRSETGSLGHESSGDGDLTLYSATEHADKPLELAQPDQVVRK